MEENSNLNNTPTEQVQPKKKKHVLLKIILILLLCIIIGIPAYIGGKTLYNKYSPIYAESGFSGVVKAIVNGDASQDANRSVVSDKASEPANTPQPAETSAPKADVPKAEEKVTSSKANDILTAAELYEKNVNATVAITTKSTVNYWGQSIQSGAKGSGFIVSEDGYTLTNYHVIEGSDSVTVATYDGNEYDAEIIGYDESNDIAILKINGDSPFQCVTLGDSDELKVGDEVVAIGNPLGELTFSMTKGSVSALARNVALSSNISMKLIQTDCAINSGNSGGALFNMKGEVIGITNAKYSSNGMSGEASIEGIGFAIPINSVYDIVTSIIEKGYIVKPYVGVTVSPAGNDALTALNIKAGAMVRAVVEGSPAAEAGIKENDIIYSVNGKEFDDYSYFPEFISSSNAGDKIKLGIIRSGEKIEIEVEVGQTEKSAKANEEAEKEQNSSSQIPDGQNGMQEFSNGQNGLNQMPEGFEDFNFGQGGQDDWMNEFFNYYFGQR